MQTSIVFLIPLVGLALAANNTNDTRKDNVERLKPSVQIQHIIIPGQVTHEAKDKVETGANVKQQNIFQDASKSEDERTDRLIGYGVVPPQNFYGRDYYGYPGYNPYHVTGEFAPNCADSYPNRRYSCYNLGRRR